MCLSEIRDSYVFSDKSPPRLAKLVAQAGGLVGAGALLLRLPSELPLVAIVTGVDVMSTLLALGWVFRSVVHAMLGYFLPTLRPDVPPYRLMLASFLNATFAVLWLSAAVLLLQHPDPFASMATMAIASVLAFAFSLWILHEAGRAEYQRGSEWMRALLRERLEPARNTWIGWLLLKLIDWRSDEKELSTYVEGTLALLLIGLVLMASAAEQILPAQATKSPHVRLRMPLDAGEPPSQSPPLVRSPSA